MPKLCPGFLTANQDGFYIWTQFNMGLAQFYFLPENTVWANCNQTLMEWIWVVLYLHFVCHSHPLTNIAETLKSRKRTLVEWSLVDTFNAIFYLAYPTHSCQLAFFLSFLCHNMLFQLFARNIRLTLWVLGILLLNCNDLQSAISL